MISSKTTLRRLLFLFAALLPATVFAQNNQALVDTLSKKLAIKEQLNEVPDDIRQQFAQNPMQISPDKNQQMLDYFDEAYNTKLLLRDFKSALAQKLTDEHADAISQWLNQQNAQEITHANQEFYTLQGKRKQVVTMYEMDQKAPSAERKQLISSLVDTTSAVDASVESSVIVLRSIIKALNKVSTQRNFSDDQVNMIISNFKMQMQSQAAQQLQSQLMVMYYSVKPGTLRNYLAFLQSDTGQWLHHAISESIQSAYEAAADRFSDSVNQ